MILFGKSEVLVDDQKINKLLTKNVEEIFVLDSLKKKLKSGKVLRIKLGFDPTGSNIHIGRAVVLRKLKEFQDLGHKIVFIVGDFTALIGDPSDKLEKRPMLTEKDVKENLKNYKEQIGKIIDLKKCEFYYNSEWLSKLNFTDITKLAESFSVGQMSNRRNFKERLDRGDEVSLREFLYPLMQGYDSVQIDADVEIGGFDQLFNLKAGRTIQKFYEKEEQDIMTTVMLEGTDGRKMSTSWGNVINISDEPNDMFGKVMSLRDDLIIKYLTICTDLPEEEIKKTEEGLKSNNTNPRDAKILLAKEIVSIYHSKEEADLAEQNFIEVFSEGHIPKDVEEIFVSNGTKLIDVLLEKGFVESKSSWRRLVNDGAILLIETKEKLKDVDHKINGTGTYKIGKKRFIRVGVKD